MFKLLTYSCKKEREKEKKTRKKKSLNQKSEKTSWIEDIDFCFEFVGSYYLFIWFIKISRLNSHTHTH